MSPIDWLRGKTKQKPKMAASGGIVHSDRALIDPGDGYLMPTSAPEPNQAQPVAFIQFDVALLTNDHFQQIRDSIQVMRRPRAPEPWIENCPCVAIYSECQRKR